MICALETLACGILFGLKLHTLKVRVSSIANRSSSGCNGRRLPWKCFSGVANSGLRFESGPCNGGPQPSVTPQLSSVTPTLSSVTPQLPSVIPDHFFQALFQHFFRTLFPARFVWWCTAACAEWFPMGTRRQAFGYMAEHGYMHPDDDGRVKPTVGS